MYKFRIFLKLLELLIITILVSSCRTVARFVYSSKMSKLIEVKFSVLLVFFLFLSLTLSAYNFKEYKHLAEKDNPEAQYIIAKMYYFGDNFEDNKVKQDYHKAFYWFMKSAKLGDYKSQHYLGMMYATGTGVNKDDNIAIYWLKKASDTKTNIVTALSEKWIADIHFKGSNTVSRSYKKAFHWYNKSANHGNPISQYILGELYFYGTGTLRDCRKAKYWIKKAYENKKTSKFAKEFWEENKLWKY